MHFAVQWDIVNYFPTIGFVSGPKSWMSTPDNFAISQLAQRDGNRRKTKLSMRSLRQPLTTS